MLGKIWLAHNLLLWMNQNTSICNRFNLVTEIDDYPGALMVVTHNEMLLHAFAEKLIVFGENGRNVLEPIKNFSQSGWADTSMENRKEKGSSFKHQKIQRSEIILERARFDSSKTEIEELEKIIEHEEMSKKIEVKLLNAYTLRKQSFPNSEFSPLAGKLKVA